MVCGCTQGNSLIMSHGGYVDFCRERENAKIRALVQVLEKHRCTTDVLGCVLEFVFVPIDVAENKHRFQLMVKRAMTFSAATRAGRHTHLDSREDDECWEFEAEWRRESEKSFFAANCRRCGRYVSSGVQVSYRDVRDLKNALRLRCIPRMLGMVSAEDCDRKPEAKLFLLS